jgi:hypothetical protein
MIGGERDEGRASPGGAPDIGAIVAERLSRREVMGGLVAAAAAAMVPAWAADAADGSALAFTELRKGLDETHHVARGYSASVLIRWGDPVLADAPTWHPVRQSAEAQARQFGTNNDFLAFLPLAQGSGRSDHGLLCVNHEYSRAAMMFDGVADSREVTRAQAEIEMAAHGHSVIEIRRDDGVWRVVSDSAHARRLTASGTVLEMSGPAAGDPRLITKADPSGRKVVGTLNNCGGGVTPWGTVLLAEENFHFYFGGFVGSGPEAANLQRYGIGGPSRFGWLGHHDRFDVARNPNEANRFGWVVELDPFDPASTPRKRTALGRFKHEAATVAINRDGRVVVYSGDDQIFEYIYRFVSRERFDPERPAANRDLLDEGTLSVARFGADGHLDWLPLVWGEGPLNPENGFHGPADVVIEARRAADLLGATPMDRPEDIETNPTTGRVYVVLTGNAFRGAAQTDGPNPRGPNLSGHILELIPPGGAGVDHGAERFLWNILLLAGQPRSANSAVSADGWLANPDNLAFDSRGRLWIATDTATAARGFANGLWACELAGPRRAVTRHFFRAPVLAEVCGPCFTPDDTTLFVSIQHPGADFYGTTFARPRTRWPDFAPGIPPRSAVVAITKNDGGPIGG